MKLEAVRIYRNLSAKNKKAGRTVYSIQTHIPRKGWRVTHYFDPESQTLTTKEGSRISLKGEPILLNFHTKVQTGILEKIREAKVKQVHAFLCGTLTDELPNITSETPVAKVAYTVKRGEFFDVWDNKKIEEKGSLLLSHYGILQVETEDVTDC